LSRALLESEKYGIPDRIKHASTLLNICATLSNLKKYFIITHNIRHNNALVYASKAVRLLLKTLNRVDDIDKSKTTSENLSSTQATNDNSEDFIILGIAYYNMGTEYEYIKDYSKAVSAYDKGLEVLNGKMSSDSFIYQNLLKALKNAKEKHILLWTYHNDCAKARSLGSPRVLYMGKQEIDKKDIIISNSIKEEKKYNQLSESLLPIEEAINSTWYWLS